MVTQSGDTTDFTGVGTPNPKLVITQKMGMDPAGVKSMLQIEQWANNLMQSGAFSEISHTYAVSGTIVVPSGGTGYLPPFFMPSACTLLGVMTKVRSGSLTLDIQQNGSNIDTGIAVTTSATFTAISETVAANDSFQPVVTAVSSADGLSCAFYFEV